MEAVRIRGKKTKGKGEARKLRKAAAGQPVAKRVKLVFNPFLVAKSSYTRQIFKVNNPFVRVQTYMSLEEMEMPDKISDGQMMSRAALEAAGRILLRPVALLRGGRILHAGVLMNLNLLTRPPRCPQARGDGEQEDMQLRAGGRLLVPCDDNDDLPADFLDPLELLRSNKYDFSGLVRDSRLDPENDLVTVLLVECDWDTLSINKSYQGAGYCMTKAIKNMEKGRYEDIYVQAWGRAHWRHAVFVPEAIVEVVDGHVVHVTGQYDAEKLDRLLQKKTMQLPGDYETVTKFPTGKYVKGIFRLCTEPLLFPLASSEKAIFQTDEVKLFYQGLMRIFIGDKVLQWTPEDVVAAWMQREKELDADVEKLLLSRTGTSK